MPEHRVFHNEPDRFSAVDAWCWAGIEKLLAATKTALTLPHSDIPYRVVLLINWADDDLKMTADGKELGGHSRTTVDSLSSIISYLRKTLSKLSNLTCLDGRSVTANLRTYCWSTIVATARSTQTER